LRAAILITPTDKPRFVLRPRVFASARRTYCRGDHDRELISGAHFNAGGDPMAGRRAVDHDDSHDLLLYPIATKRALNLGDAVTDRDMTATWVTRQNRDAGRNRFNRLI
jgi:hypothetical protein